MYCSGKYAVPYHRYSSKQKNAKRTHPALTSALSPSCFYEDASLTTTPSHEPISRSASPSHFEQNLRNEPRFSLHRKPIRLPFHPHKLHFSAAPGEDQSMRYPTHIAG